jgi:hypothetical protein
MQQEEKEPQPRQEKPRRIKALQPRKEENTASMERVPEHSEESESATLGTPTKEGVLLSPQDVVVECKGHKISTHSNALRLCKYFTTILDDAGLDDNKPITLPDSFDPLKVREFICTLYDCLDSDSRLHLDHTLKAGNIISLTELAHYFDAPILHLAGM